MMAMAQLNNDSLRRKTLASTRRDSDPFRPLPMPSTPASFREAAAGRGRLEPGKPGQVDGKDRNRQVCRRVSEVLAAVMGEPPLTALRFPAARHVGRQVVGTQAGVAKQVEHFPVGGVEVQASSKIVDAV